jgi:hypothetical protein
VAGDLTCKCSDAFSLISHAIICSVIHLIDLIKSDLDLQTGHRLNSSSKFRPKLEIVRFRLHAHTFVVNFVVRLSKRNTSLIVQRVLLLLIVIS